MQHDQEPHNPWLFEDTVPLHVGLGIADATDLNGAAEVNILCSKCCALLQGSKIILELCNSRSQSTHGAGELSEVFDHMASIYDVSESASRGCHLCSILVASLIRHGHVSSVEKALRKRSLSLTDFVNYRQVSVNIERAIVDDYKEEDKEADVRIYLDVTSISGPTDDWHPLRCIHPNLEVIPVTDPMPPAVALCFSTASNAMYTLANGWLDQCSQTHSSCQALTQKITQDWLPKRLIFVGEAGEATLQLRVLETSHFTYSQQQSISYCTLSHRWGNGNIPKLTQVNLETWKTAIPQSALPLTFQQAIDVARGLNLKFIWIDALCILQDSKEELQQEIERMGTIFMYSKVTIAALAANDSADGLFTWRNPLALYPLSIPALHDARITVQPPYTEKSGETLNHDLSFNAKEDAPLLDRGWVFQEQVLSPRTLFYGRQGLYWECREAHSSDYTPDFEPGGWSGSDELFPYLKGLFIPLLSMLNRGEDIYDEAQQIWMDMVSFFTTRSLSHSSDRCRALLGIAEVLQKLTGSYYFHGMFKASGREHLMWECKDPRAPLKYFQGGPSWSWESYEGAIEFASKYGDRHEHIWECGHFKLCKRSYSLEPPNANELKGCLTFGTTLIRMDWRATGDALNSYHVWPTQCYQGTEYYSSSLDSEIPRGTEVWWLSLGYWGQSEIFKGDQIWLMEKGLLVILKDQNRNEWTRIGFLSLRIKNGYCGHPENALVKTIHLI